MTAGVGTPDASRPRGHRPPGPGARRRGLRARRAAGRVPVALAAVLPAVVAGPPPVAAQDVLTEVAEEAAQAWSRNDAEALAALMRAPVAVRLGDENHPALDLRQARAAVRRFMDETGEGPVRLGRVRELGGSPARGFAELWWSPGSPAGRRGPTVTLFLGLESGDDGWKVVEVRLVS